MSSSEDGDERAESSSPPARRAILEARDQFWRASDAVRLRPVPCGSVGVPDGRGRGVVRARYWASFTAFGRGRSGLLIQGKRTERGEHKIEGCAYFGPPCRRIQAQTPQLPSVPVASVGSLKDPCGGGLFVLQSPVILRLLRGLVLLKNLPFFLILNLGN